MTTVLLKQSYHVQTSTCDGEHVVVQLLTDVVADATSKNRVMIDILNEPDARGIK